MNQLDLFGEPDTKTQVAALEARRRSQPKLGPPPPEQAKNDREAILTELRKGPTTADKLQEICMGYRQRISDLRKAGYVIKCRKLTGRLSLYELKS